MNARRRGFSLTEVLVAGACFCVCIVPVLAMTASNQTAAHRRASKAKQVATANMMAEGIGDLPVLVLKKLFRPTPEPIPDAIANYIHKVAQADGKTLFVAEGLEALGPLIERMGVPFLPPAPVVEAGLALVPLPDEILQMSHKIANFMDDILQHYRMYVSVEPVEGKPELVLLTVKVEPRAKGRQQGVEVGRLLCRHL
jgi:hypothetical protein